ncbi:MAG: CvpA family protein [Treponema sp.]|nr:CvpA family protein [Treponema sp.]MBR3543441.1 CvpA family protein [Treponema sp.]
MNVLDYIFIAILLIFTIRGFVRGLINEVFGIGSLIFSLFAGIMLYQKMAEVFSRSMSPLLSKILGFLAVFICAFILIKIIQLLLKTIFSGAVLGSLDKTLGLLLGFVEGAALVFVLLLAMVEFNGTIDTSNLRERSVVSNYIEQIPI